MIFGKSSNDDMTAPLIPFRLARKNVGVSNARSFDVLILVIYFITDYREVLQKCLEKLTDVNFGVNSSEEV